MKKFGRLFCEGMAAAPLVAAVSCFCNRDLSVTPYVFQSKKLPHSFDGAKILQLSDLHGKEYGFCQSGLLALTKKEKPDIIFITGDLVGRDDDDWKPALSYVKGAVKIAPVYFVTGNHECYAGRYPFLKRRLEQCGAAVLENETAVWQRDGGEIMLLGLMDPTFWGTELLEKGSMMQEENLKRLAQETKGKFRILLSHRPEKFPLYQKCGIELTFSGHAHGGQIRLPFTDGLYAPGQGIFPRYTSGIYRKNGAALVVSRGAGYHYLPLRFRNRPELVTVTLHC